MKVSADELRRVRIALAEYARTSGMYDAVDVASIAGRAARYAAGAVVELTDANHVATSKHAADGDVRAQRMSREELWTGRVVAEFARIPTWLIQSEVWRLQLRLVTANKN